VVLMQSSESEDGIFCHSSAPIAAVRGFVSRDWDWIGSRGSGDWKLWRAFFPHASKRVATSRLDRCEVDFGSGTSTSDLSVKGMLLFCLQHQTQRHST
jgi:hypothetical protein